MSQKKRKYQDNYFDFGFTYLIENDLQIPQCVVCTKTFSNSTMKPASLKQHLANAHPSMMSKNRSFFESKLSSLKRQKLDQTRMFWRTNKAAVHASYAIALHVAKTKMPHNIGETLLKPCILESVKMVLAEKASQTMKQIPLSNDTIKSRIHEMSDNIKSKVLSKIDSSPVFALQLDESWILIGYPISHSYLSMSDMLQMKGLMRNFCSVNLWKQLQRQSMFFKC